MDNIRNSIRVVQDFPKPGIGFFDITTALKDPEVFRKIVDTLAEKYKDVPIDRIAGIESRGFIFASALGYVLNKGVILIRKPGKLPAETISEEYTLEYGTDSIEMHTDSVEEGMNILVLDDLLATGGTAVAACNLIERAGGKVAGLGLLIELAFLNARSKLEKYDVYSMMAVDGE